MALKTVLFFAAAMAASISIPPAGAQDHGRVFELRPHPRQPRKQSPTGTSDRNDPEVTGVQSCALPISILRGGDGRFHFDSTCGRAGSRACFRIAHLHL